MKISEFLARINDLLESGLLSPNADVSIKTTYIGSELTYDQSDFCMEESYGGMLLKLIPESESLE